MASSPSYNPNSLRIEHGLRSGSRTTRARAAGQPRHAVRLRARLDVQGRDRHRRDRQRAVHARIDGQRAQRRRDLGGPAAERRQRELRPDHAHRSARELGQHRLGAGRRKGRQADDGALHGRFGFDRKPQARLPGRRNVGQRRVRRRTPDLAARARKSTSAAWAIGQDKLAVVPLQMAEVAAAVANGGRLMTPHLTSRIVNSEGQTVQRVKPRVQSVVMKTSTAAAVTDDDGSGRERRHRHQRADPRRAGRRQDGNRRDADRQRRSTTCGSSPSRPPPIPKVAIAVTLKGVPGQGAAFAAPVAKQVMEQLLR